MERQHEALSRMEQDTDIASEAADLLASRLHVGGSGQLLTSTRAASRTMGAALRHVPLNWRPGQGGHRPNEETVRLLQEAGGRDELKKFTEAFYQLCFRDPHIDRFIREHADPHGERFANW
jgi:hypothetical protein